jgi:magnesium transporter
MGTQIQERDLARPVIQFIEPVESALSYNLSVGAALEELRNRPLKSKIFYFYIVDDQNRIVGVVPTRRLLLSRPNQVLSKIMDSPAKSIPSTASLQEAMELLSRYHLLALPVVDEDGRLLGTVDVQLYSEEVLDLAESRRLHDIFQLMGLSAEQLKYRNTLTGFRHRMPWLLCNIIGGITCAIIAAGFRHVLEQVVLIAMFIPLVLTLSEAISMQSMTLTLNFLRGTRTHWKQLLRQGAWEWKTALLLGMTCAIFVAFASSFWGRGFSSVAVISASLVISMIASSTLGVALPVSLHLVRLDPKVASGPVVLMLGDIITVTVYLGLATWWLL